MRNTDETGGWIFSSEAHTWMDATYPRYAGRGGFYSVRTDASPGPPLSTWDKPCRWPVPFEEHDLNDTNWWAGRNWAIPAEA